MTKEIRVLVCDPISETALWRLREAGLRVFSIPDITQEELLRRVGDFEVLVVRGRTRITEQVIERASSLRIIGRAGSGLDNIDLEAAAKRGVKVFNAPEAVAEAVAELTVGMMIAVNRKLLIADRSLRSGKWLKDELTGFELSGKTLGIVGFGRIGRRVATIAKAFDMTILANDIVEIPHEVLKKTETQMVGLEELLRRSDHVTLHTPLTESTRHLIDERRLRMMKRTSILINVSRGDVVDEESLYRALREGWIRGAALDVFSVEPPTGNKLLELDNVVVSPHIGAQTYESLEKMGNYLADKIITELTNIGTV